MPTSPLPLYVPAIPPLLTTGLQHDPALQKVLYQGPDAQASDASEAANIVLSKTAAVFKQCFGNVGEAQEHFAAQACIALTLLRMISGAK